MRRLAQLDLLWLAVIDAAVTPFQLYLPGLEFIAVDVTPIQLGSSKSGSRKLKQSALAVVSATSSTPRWVGTMVESTLVNGYQVLTEFNEDVIVSEVCYQVDGLRERVMRDVVKLRDDGVRSALIALGWTPPGEVKPLPRTRMYSAFFGETPVSIAANKLGSEHRWQEVRDLNVGKFPNQGPHDFYPHGAILVIPVE